MEGRVVVVVEWGYGNGLLCGEWSVDVVVVVFVVVVVVRVGSGRVL